MRDWEPQKLPGILEDDPSVPVPVSWPSATVERIGENLRRLYIVDLPDWLETPRSASRLWAARSILFMWKRCVDAMLTQVERELNRV